MATAARDHVEREVVVVEPVVTLTMSVQEAVALLGVLMCVGGPTDGARAFTDNIGKALESTIGAHPLLIQAVAFQIVDSQGGDSGIYFTEDALDAVNRTVNTLIEAQ